MNSQLSSQFEHEPPVRQRPRHRNYSDTMTTATTISGHSAEKCDDWEAHTVTAVYPYEPENQDELYLQPGDRVHVLSNDCRLSGSEGWWVGQLHQQVGVFPASYVLDQCPEHYLPNNTVGLPVKYKPQASFIPELSTLTSLPNEDLSSMALPLPSLSRLPSYNSAGNEREDEIDRVQIIPSGEVRQLDCIGSGAFGTVYRGRCKGKDVALKVFNTTSEQVCNEASHLLGLSHQNIIQMLGLVQLPNGLALMMELAHGGALSRLIEPRPPPPLGVLPLLCLVRQVVEGMMYLHDQVQLSHRDLKTANILIREHLPPCPCEEDFYHKTVVITDFGMARYLSQMMSQQSKFGTVAYAAPEVCRQKIPFSLKSDVWSFGVVLWELLTFEIPFKHLEHPHLLFKIAKYNHTLYVPESLPEEFSLLLQECWSIEPDDRPSFREIAQRLDDAMRGDFAQLLSLQEFQEHQSLWREQVERHSLTEDPRHPMMQCAEDMQQLYEDERAFLDRFKEHLCEREMEINLKEQRFNEYMMNMDRQCMMLAVMTANFHKQNQGPPPRPPRSRTPFYRAFFTGLRSKSTSNSSAHNGDSSTSSSHPVIGPPSNLQHVVHVAPNDEDDGILRIFSQIDQHHKVNTWGPSGSRTHPHVRKSVCSFVSGADSVMSKSTPNLPKLATVSSQIDDLSNLSGPETPRLNNCPSCYFKALDGIETPCSQCPSDPPSRKYSASSPSPISYQTGASSARAIKKQRHKFLHQPCSVDAISPLPPLSPQKRASSLHRNQNHHQHHHHHRSHRKSSSTSHHHSTKVRTTELGLRQAMNVLLAPIIKRLPPATIEQQHTHMNESAAASSHTNSRHLYHQHRQCSCDAAMSQSAWNQANNPPRHALMKAVQDGYLKAGRHHHHDLFDNWEVSALPPPKCTMSTPHTPTSPPKVRFHGRCTDALKDFQNAVRHPPKRPQHIFQKSASEAGPATEVRHHYGCTTGSTDTLLDSAISRHDGSQADASDDTPTSRDTQSRTKDDLESAVNALQIAPD